MLDNKEMDSITFVLPKWQKEMLINFFKDEVTLDETKDIDSAITFHLWNGVYLHNGLMPIFKHGHAYVWFEKLYSNYIPSSQVLADIFADNAEGIHWQSKGLDMKPFIEYAIDEQGYLVNKDVNLDKFGYVLEQFCSIRNMFEENNFGPSSPKCDADTQQACCRQLDHFIEIFHNDKKEIPFTDIYQFFLSNINFLEKSTFTSRALMGLVEMQKGWRNDADSRLKLVSLFHPIDSQTGHISL